MLIEACAKQFFPDGGHLLALAGSAWRKRSCDLVAAARRAGRAAADHCAIRCRSSPTCCACCAWAMAGLAASMAARKARGASIDAVLARVARRGARASSSPTTPAYQRLEAGRLRALFDVGGAPPLSYSERAHASALAFELSSENERLIVNVGAARELEPAARLAARATNGALNADRSPTRCRPRWRSRARQGRRASPAPISTMCAAPPTKAASPCKAAMTAIATSSACCTGAISSSIMSGANLRGIDELIRPTKLKTPTAEKADPVRRALPPAPERARALAGTSNGAAGNAAAANAGACAPTRRTSRIAPSIYWGGANSARDDADRAFRRSRPDGPRPRPAQPHALGADAGLSAGFAAHTCSSVGRDNATV